MQTKHFASVTKTYHRRYHHLARRRKLRPYCQRSSRKSFCSKRTHAVSCKIVRVEAAGQASSRPSFGAIFSFPVKRALTSSNDKSLIISLLASSSVIVPIDDESGVPCVNTSCGNGMFISATGSGAPFARLPDVTTLRRSDRRVSVCLSYPARPTRPTGTVFRNTAHDKLNPTKPRWTRTRWHRAVEYMKPILQPFKHFEMFFKSIEQSRVKTARYVNPQGIP